MSAPKTRENSDGSDVDERDGGEGGMMAGGRRGRRAVGGGGFKKRVGVSGWA